MEQRTQADDAGAGAGPKARAPYSYRTDASVPPFPDDRPIFVFDGFCALCSGSARFVMRHDPKARFRLLPAQSPLGQALYRHYRLDPGRLDSVILLAKGRAYLRSDAVVRVATILGWPWRAAALLLLVPRRLRDAAYDLVARNRFRWFGRLDTCARPTPDQARRFLA